MGVGEQSSFDEAFEYRQRHHTSYRPTEMKGVSHARGSDRKKLISRLLSNSGNGKARQIRKAKSLSICRRHTFSVDVLNRPDNMELDHKEFWRWGWEFWRKSSPWEEANAAPSRRLAGPVHTQKLLNRAAFYFVCTCFFTLSPRWQRRYRLETQQISPTDTKRHRKFNFADHLRLIADLLYVWKRGACLICGSEFGFGILSSVSDKSRSGSRTSGILPERWFSASARSKMVKGEFCKVF